MKQKSFQPDCLISYFREEQRVLILVTLSGLIYNIGLLANPWFEGKLAGCLVEVLSGDASSQKMLRLVCWYVLVIVLVQAARYLKRFYVRRFANNINRQMKKILYHNLLSKSKAELETEGIGNVMIKAVSDVDDCVEGMRKFTTEVFDTGVALVCYVAMLFWYDWHLALITMVFPPVSYVLAEKMKVVVQRTGAKYKDQAGRLSADTLDRVSNALTYRVFGCEEQRNQSYEETLTAYEKSARKANVWVIALPPLYHVICMTGAIFILYFGARNITGEGWRSWDIAAFTTFLSCYAKLSVKSSKAAKLFHSVQKAQVSWNRIRPFMKAAQKTKPVEQIPPKTLTVRNLGFAYPTGKQIFSGLSFQAQPGELIGITGPVACGKSTLGRVFLCEQPYQGSIRFGEKELSELPQNIRRSIAGYLGHDPELQNDSIRNNVLMGENKRLAPFLQEVCLDEEVMQMEEREDTFVGSGGVRLSGGQAKRLALARTLVAEKPLLILDDPFSALDRKTEELIFARLKQEVQNRIVLLISHRLYLFPQCQQIIWMDQGNCTVSDHKGLMKQNPRYAELYLTQKGGSDDEK